MTKTIYIKGQPYKVTKVKTLYTAQGATNLKDKSIYIAENEEKEEFFKTLIHELIHAYLYECGLVQYSDNEILVHWLDTHFLPIYNKAFDLYEMFEGGKKNNE